MDQAPPDPGVNRDSDCGWGARSKDDHSESVIPIYDQSWVDGDVV